MIEPQLVQLSCIKKWYSIFGLASLICLTLSYKSFAVVHNEGYFLIPQPVHWPVLEPLSTFVVLLGGLHA